MIWSPDSVIPVFEHVLALVVLFPRWNLFFSAVRSDVIILFDLALVVGAGIGMRFSPQSHRK